MLIRRSLLLTRQPDQKLFPCKVYHLMFCYIWQGYGNDVLELKQLSTKQACSHKTLIHLLFQIQNLVAKDFRLSEQSEIEL